VDAVVLIQQSGAKVFLSDVVGLAMVIQMGRWSRPSCLPGAPAPLSSSTMLRRA
jgi:hypothetical protein